MAKVQVTLDATKLRNLVSKRTYKNKEGQDVEVQEVKFELVEVKEPKQIYEKDNMKIMKTHFASAIQTKEERVKLVFAVKIAIDNSGKELKPGMPADAVIETGEQ